MIAPSLFFEISDLVSQLSDEPDLAADLLFQDILLEFFGLLSLVQPLDLFLLNPDLMLQSAFLTFLCLNLVSLLNKVLVLLF